MTDTRRFLRGPHAWGWAACLAVAAAAACGGPQSALEPAGRGAERIADLFFWMAAGSAVIWLAVLALTIHAVRVSPDSYERREATLLIIGGGTIVPTVVLTILLAYGLAVLRDLVAPAPNASLRIAVTGEQWWWRVRYLVPGDHGPVELANEIRLPVGEPVEFELESLDVIHSFWIPALGGKMDMIPGRKNRLTLEPTRTGVFRGVCAEYCGTSHALMSFSVVVLEKAEFDRWLARQAAPAEAPAEPLRARGRDLLLQNGCGACHTVRGTAADGMVGPDLTHVGGRLRVGAGLLPNEPEAFLSWMARTDQLKPAVHMPAFGMLPRDDLRAMAAFLDGLE